MPVVQETSMKFKKLLGALAISLVPAAAAAQSGKLTTNYSDGQKYVCASYWNPNPRIRLCYEGDDKFTFGTFIPLSKSKLKIAAGNTGDIEEQGIYFTQEKGPLLMGTGAEHLNGGLSAEGHAKINRSEEHTTELQSHFHLFFPLFFLNEPATPEISPLSLHDALPIWKRVLC